MVEAVILESATIRAGLQGLCVYSRQSEIQITKRKELVSQLYEAFGGSGILDQQLGAALCRAAAVLVRHASGTSMQWHYSHPHHSALTRG
jgi:hypothetical protein